MAVIEMTELAKEQGMRFSELVLGDNFLLSLDLIGWRTRWKHEAKQAAERERKRKSG